MLIPRRLLLVCMSLILSFTFLSIISSAAYYNGDITITNNTIWKDEARIHEGNIIINSGGNLTIDSTQILFNSTNGNYGINVNGGNLTIRRNSFISVVNDSDDSIMWTWIYVTNAGSVRLRDSVIERINGSANPPEQRAGITLKWISPNSYIDNMTIRKWNSSQCTYGAISTPYPLNVTNSLFDRVYNTSCLDEVALYYVSAIGSGNRIAYNNRFYGVRRAIQSVDNANLSVTYNKILNPSTPISFFRNIKDSYSAYNEVNYTDPYSYSYASLGCNVNCTNILYEHNTINGINVPGLSGIHFNIGASNITVRYNTFRKMTRGGIDGGGYANANQYGFQIYGNVFEDLILDPDGEGGYFGAYNLLADDSIVYDNIFRRAICPFCSCIITGNPWGANPNSMKNVKFINNTLDTCYYGIVLENTTQLLFIDNRILNTTYADIDFSRNVSNVKFINTYFNESKVMWGVYKANTTNDMLDNYYYADFFVTDSDNQPLSNMKLLVSNDINLSYPPINRNGEIKTMFITAADGHTSLPLENNSETAVLMNYWRSPQYRQNMSYSVFVYDENNIWTNIMQVIYPNGTVIQQQSLMQITGIDPDSSWYRPNPDIPSNTVVLQINHTKTGIIANPSDNPVSITVSKWDTSAAKGDVLANFTADTDSNAVMFTIGSLTAGKSYLIRKDNNDFTVVQADTAGKINFSNSLW